MSNENSLIFKHSGDLGDIILSLPAMCESGGGSLLLDPEGGLREPLVRWANYNHTKLNKGSIDFITPLLERQSYIDSIGYWGEEKVDVNLDKFRMHNKYNCLMSAHLDSVGKLSTRGKWSGTPWIDVPSLELPEGKKYILSRSCRYHSNYTFWETLDDSVIDSSVFVSLDWEYEYFMKTFPRYQGRVERLDTSDALSLAGYIKSADMIITNQSFVYCLAEAMKKKLMLEVYRVHPSSIIQREGATYV
ncbi:MAG: hypothetical protein CL605_05495 [Altibacter sp.]|uniref:hypothetical protein n=1 Tax=Altibacter sp. TaxID=2024823 RepID=UPI000C918B4F|nr:hypothetical protein [Altibacter sp.]MAP54338.1 hypothetical protein [Altibacter sp.]|tara:strand:- start:9580 stop:10320 length:741 start_codon:yes stop_codon:yes gene_type:complete